MSTENRNRAGKWFGKLIKDFRFAARVLLKTPGFTVLAALSLGLGIGTVSIFFGLFDTLVLRPFPYPDPDRIAYVWSNESSDLNLPTPVSLPDFEDIRDRNTSFADIGVYTAKSLTMDFERPEPAFAARCTAGILRAFAMQPLMGRLIEDADVKEGAAPVAVISHALWRRVFNADPNAIGRSIRLNGQAATVVGIMPPDFEMEDFYLKSRDIDLWIPLVRDNTTQDVFFQQRGSQWLRKVQRHKGTPAPG